MDEKPHELFEQQIKRIHQLLSSPGTEVTWNDRIPDPDNPDQLRQIDISVRRDGQLTIIECRDHKAKQDVKWVEELAGRRISLNADLIVGVSSSGFTTGALLKATRLGVILRALETLSPEEVTKWGNSSELTLIFYEFRDAEIEIILPRSFEGEALKLTNRVGDHIHERDLLMKIADRYDLSKGEDKFFAFKAKLDGDFLVNDIPVKNMSVKGRIRSRRYQANAPVVSIYGNSSHIAGTFDARVEKFEIGQSQVITGQELSSLVFDLSRIKIPDRCVFGFPMIFNADGLRVSRAEVIGTDNILQSKVSIKYLLQWPTD